MLKRTEFSIPKGQLSPQQEREAHRRGGLSLTGTGGSSDRTHVSEGTEQEEWEDEKQEHRALWPWATEGEAYLETNIQVVFSR